MDIPIRPYKIEIQITTGNESAVEGLFGWKFCTFIRPNQERGVYHSKKAYEIWGFSKSLRDF